MELKPGSEFTWISIAPGLRVTARHAVEPIAAGSRAMLSIRYEGLFGKLLALWLRRITECYLQIEATGLKARSIEFSRTTDLKSA